MLGVGLSTLFVGMAMAQEEKQDREELKKRVLRRVEERLRQEEERILKEVSKIVDEEFARLRGEKPSTTESAGKEKPKAAKKKARGYLGIRPGELTEEERKDLGLEGEAGIRIAEVLPDSPAEKGGLKDEDIILEIDDRKIGVPSELPPLVQSKGAGTEITVKILREKERMALTIKLAPHPDDPEEPEDKEEGKREGGLRDRIKKFLEEEGDQDKKEGDKDKRQSKKSGKRSSKKASSEDSDLFALNEDMFEQMRGMVESFGMDLESFFEKGSDGKYRLNEEYREMLRQFMPDLDSGRLRELMEQFGMSSGEEEEKPRQKPRKKPSVRTGGVSPAHAGKKAWLGIVPEAVSEETRAKMDLEEGVGLFVAEVSDGSPAEAAGIQPNDIILELNGSKVTGESSIAQFMEKAKAGDAVEVVILRKGKRETLKVTLRARKD